LGQVKFIVCGRREPQLDRTWFVAEVRELRPMASEHIFSYLQRRGVDWPSAQLEGLAQILFQVGLGEGSMMKIATLVDGYLRQRAA
jgi:hypothetical protein